MRSGRFSTFTLLLVAASLLTGCTTSRDPLASLPKEAQDEAGRRVTVAPSPFSTLEFKELDEGKRSSALTALVKDAWQADCRPTDAAAITYTPRGDSLWRVRCAGSTLSQDYVVTIPESRATGARVLKCYSSSVGGVGCNILGRPA